MQEVVINAGLCAGEVLRGGDSSHGLAEVSWEMEMTEWGRGNVMPGRV